MRTKDEIDRLRERVITLCLEGKSRREIRAVIGPIRESGKRHPTPPRLSAEECRKRSAEGSRRYWEAERPAREARLADVAACAAAEATA